MPVIRGLPRGCGTLVPIGCDIRTPHMRSMLASILWPCVTISGTPRFRRLRPTCTEMTGAARIRSALLSAVSPRVHSVQCYEAFLCSTCAMTAKTHVRSGYEFRCFRTDLRSPGRTSERLLCTRWDFTRRFFRNHPKRCRPPPSPGQRIYPRLLSLPMARAVYSQRCERVTRESVPARH